MNTHASWFILLLISGCASQPASIPLSTIARCDPAQLETDAKSRLTPPKPQAEISYALAVYESRESLEVSYVPKLATNDKDRLVISAGGQSAIYDKRTCAFKRMKYWR